MKIQVVMSLAVVCFGVMFVESAWCQEVSSKDDKATLQHRVTVLQEEVQKDKNMLDSVLAIKRKHERQYIDGVIHSTICKELFKTILRAGDDIRQSLSVSEYTDTLAFFDVQPSRSLNELAADVDMATDSNIREASDQNKMDLDRKFPKYRIGDVATVTTRNRTRKGILRQIGEESIVIGSNKVLRNDMITEERIRFFDADRKAYLNKMNVRSRSDVQFNKTSSLAEKYLSNGYLPVNSVMELDFSGKPLRWISRKELCNAVLQSKWEYYSKEIKRDFESNKPYLSIFKTQQEYEEWRLHAGKRLFELGCCYIYGKGVSKDEAKAYQCFQSSSELGNLDALTNIGLCYLEGVAVEKNTSKAFSCFTMAAGQGGVRATDILGRCYFNGWGTKVDKPKAISLWKDAALKGYAESMYQLGLLYNDGEVVPKNIARAFNYFNDAANKDLPFAQFQTAACYEFGHGVGRNYLMAKKWYKAVMNNEDANDELRAKALNGYGDSLVKGLRSTNDLTDFFYGCGHSFKMFPICKDFSCFDFVKSLASYSNSHKEAFDRSKAMRQMMEFIIIAKDYIEVAEKYNNMCLQLDKKVAEYVRMHDEYVDIYNDMQRYPAGAKVARDAAQGMSRCRAEINKYRNLAVAEARNRDSALKNASFNWGMAQKCYAILKKAIDERRQLSEVQGVNKVENGGNNNNDNNVNDGDGSDEE